MAEGRARRWRARLLAGLRHWHRARLVAREARRAAEQYPRWVAAHDTPDAVTLEALARRVPAQPPTLVWLVDTAGAAPAALAATEASVRASLGAVPQQVLPFGAGGADAAWARARASSPDAWIAELPAGTRLAPHAAALLAEAIVQHPAARAVYADHDHLDGTGRRVLPQCLPDWNPELMLGHAYLLPLALVQARHAVAAAASRHARWLEMTRGCAAAQVVHVPHLLAHVPGPVRVHSDATAVAQHLAALGVAVDGVDTGPWGCRPRLRPASPAPRVSVIVPTRDRLELLAPCAHAVLAAQPAVHELLIVDNGSVQAETLSFLRGLQADPRVRVLRDERPFNYAALNNRAAREAQGEWLLLLNNDTAPVHPHWLSALLGAAALQGVAAVGARLWYPDHTLQHAGLLLGLEGVAGDAHRRLTRALPGHQGRAQLIQAFSALTAACLLVRRGVFEAVGGFDEAGLAVAYNDVDLCLRIREAGHRLVWTPEAELFHFESVSRGRDVGGERAERFRREFDLMRQRWGPALSHDPAYNPNLALSGGAFKLAWPPRVSLAEPWFRGPQNT